jgi:FkbM family methyltransferase
MERDTARKALDQKFAEAAGLTERVRTLGAYLAPPSAPVVVALARVGKRLARRVAKAAYRLIRPVVRPAFWRLQGRDEGAGAEIRRLAAEMERALLTLALEPRSSEPWRGAPLAPEPAQVTLVLPHDRTTQVDYQRGDLSVAASLAASGGDWEPRVRRYLADTVQPDWVCLDIGANLGVHTLSLAVLAHEGHVVAFEADAANFALLSRNAATLATPHAAISLINLALWDRPGMLMFGGADELAGCSFVSENLDAETVERYLRTVVDGSVIDDVDLHIRSGRVAAVSLDNWANGHVLPRLNLIKLDVGGAEVRVIRGADATLRRHRPVLLVEYNPSCAAAYFGQPPEALFEDLATRFAAIHALEPDGTLTPLPDWRTLQTRLADGKGWEDLVCLP